LKSLSPSNYTPLQVIVDLANSDHINRIVGQTVETFGRIDILINNAGIEPTQRSENPSALELFDKVIAINLRACFHLCNVAFKHLMQTKGSIINVSTINNLRTSVSFGKSLIKETDEKTFFISLKPDFNTSYSISKSGIDALTRSLSVEWAQYGIRVNSVK